MSEDRKERWVRLAEAALGDIAKVPLVERLLYWIDENDLAAALEGAGILQPSYGELITAREATENALEILQRHLPPK